MLENEKLIHITINEPMHGHHYCQQYIINETLWGLMTKKLKNEIHTVGDGVDLAKYAYINYTIRKENIIPSPKSSDEIKTEFEITDLNYLKPIFSIDEKIIIINLEDGRDYFDDTIGWYLEN